MRFEIVIISIILLVVLAALYHILKRLPKSDENKTSDLQNQLNDFKNCASW